VPARDAKTADAPEVTPAAGSESVWKVRLASFDRRFPRGRLMLLLVGLLLALNVTTALRVDRVSKIDEQYWIDHLLNGADFAIDRGGAPILQETVREKCTRGFEGFPDLPKCTKGRLNPSKYGYWHGVNITGNEPFYFFVTGPIARVLRSTPIDLPPNDSLVTWARLLGSVWAIGGLYCLIRAGEILGVRRRLLLLASVFIIATPALLHANTIVTPDATALLAGGAVLLAALSWERRGSPWWLFGLVAIVAAAFNDKNGIGILLVLAYFAVRALAGYLKQADDDDLRSWPEYARISALLVVALYLANRGWDRMYVWIQTDLFPVRGLADISNNPIARSYGNRDIGFWHLFGPNTVFMMFPPFQDVAPPIERTHPLYVLFSRGAEYVAIGAMLAVALRDRLANKIGVLGFATLGTLLVSPTLTVIRNQVDGGSFDQPVWRYALAALPALAIVLACAARTRFAERSLTVLTVVLYFSAIYVVFRPPTVV